MSSNRTFSIETNKKWVLVLLALVVGIYLFLAQVHRDLTGWGIGDGFLQTLYKKKSKSLAKQATPSKTTQTEANIQVFQTHRC